LDLFIRAFVATYCCEATKRLWHPIVAKQQSKAISCRIKLRSNKNYLHFVAINLILWHMAIIVLPTNATSFPNVSQAESDGLLAMGGTITPQLIKAAYKKGIFPWYDGDCPLWWSPDPRFVLFPNKVKTSKSMKQLFKQNTYTVKFNTNFEAIISNCKLSPRVDQDGTWITDVIEETYTKLFYEKVVLCAASYDDEGKLAGGLYGVKMGNVFSGESMFALQPNASKYAFLSMVPWLIAQGISIIDCQTHTEHLESLGAEFISRDQFVKYLP
jgi:leucyl/phenylalanyl-tRNA---protein transferase